MVPPFPSSQLSIYNCKKESTQSWTPVAMDTKFYHQWKTYRWATDFDAMPHHWSSPSLKKTPVEEKTKQAHKDLTWTCQNWEPRNLCKKDKEKRSSLRCFRQPRSFGRFHCYIYIIPSPVEEDNRFLGSHNWSALSIQFHFQLGRWRANDAKTTTHLDLKRKMFPVNKQTFQAMPWICLMPKLYKCQRSKPPKLPNILLHNLSIVEPKTYYHSDNICFQPSPPTKTLPMSN